MSVPLIMLTMVEQQLFLALNRWRASTTTSSKPLAEASAPVKSSAATAVGGGSRSAAAPIAAAGNSLVSPNERGWGGAVGGNSGGLSSILIRLDCAWLLLLMGIHVRAEGLNERSLSRPAMLLFTHVSTLDAVVILGTLPRALCAVVKVG